jgi:hypothetical protein
MRDPSVAPAADSSPWRKCALFLATTESQYKNFRPIVDHLIRLGGSTGVNARILVISSLITNYRRFDWDETLCFEITEPLNRTKRRGRIAHSVWIRQVVLPRVDEFITGTSGGVIVVGNDSSCAARTLLKTLRGRGYSSLLLQDGWLEARSIRRSPHTDPGTLLGRFSHLLKSLLLARFSPFEALLNGRIGEAAEYAAVYSEKALSEFVKAGYPRSQTIVTGSPRHCLTSQSARVPDRTVAPARKPTFLLLTTYATGEMEAAMHAGIDWTIELLRSHLTDWELLVKIHPRQIKLEFEDRYANNPQVKILSGQHDLSAIWRTASVVFSYGTTLVLDALLMNRPVIQLAPPPLSEELFNYQIEIPLARSEKELSALFTQALERSRLGTSWDLSQAIYVIRDADPAWNSIMVVAELVLELANGRDHIVEQFSTPRRS